MNPTLAQLTIRTLANKSAVEMDAALCRMHSEAWHAIARELGVTLPRFGGDKPAILTGALLRLGQRST